MKNITLFILSICYIVSVHAQQNVIFKDDFSGYSNDWLLINEKEFVVAQTEGKLLISKKSQNRIMNGCMWYKKTVSGFDTSKDFTIKFDANVLSSESTVGFDVQWGKLYEADGVRIKSIHQLDFGTNKVRLSKFELDKGWTYYAWSYQTNDDAVSSFITQNNTFNTYEIEQRGQMLLVKVNNVLVYKIAINPKIGSEIGFQRCLQGEFLLDNIEIKQ